MIKTDTATMLVPVRQIRTEFPGIFQIQRMSLYVHAIGSSGHHERERRHFEYASACVQCGVRLTPETHVAAHVIAYPCNCCFGRLSLTTTCRSCNAKHQIRDDTVSCRYAPASSRFVRCCARSVSLESVTWPCCYYYKLPGDTNMIR